MIYHLSVSWMKVYRIIESTIVELIYKILSSIIIAKMTIKISEITKSLISQRNQS